MILVVGLMLTVAGLGKLTLSQQEDIAILEQANLELAIKYSDTVVESKQLNEKISESNLKLRETETYLEGFMGREDTVKAKPVLVEKMIQKSYKEREQRLECLTGGLCSEQP